MAQGKGDEEASGTQASAAEDEYHAMYGFKGSDVFPEGVGYVPTKVEGLN